jgi:(1->4)-alpha-D-glucan 1-alpha-D-glucosylmutase
VWGDSWVELPPERQHVQWINALTDQTFDTQSLGEAHGLRLAQVFETFPYALLRAHERPQPNPEEKRT